MRVAIAGGHGGVARHLTRILHARGDEALALVRRPSHLTDVAADGAEPVLCDLEAIGPRELADALGEADAVVFAAGAGRGSGVARKETVDYGAAVKLIEAAELAGARRYVMVSSFRADPEAPGDDVFDVYLRAKGRADEVLRASGLDYTIVRPASLTDQPGTGHVLLAPDISPPASVPREDVAAVLAAVLSQPSTFGVTTDLASGNVPIVEAVAALG